MAKKSSGYGLVMFNLKRDGARDRRVQINLKEIEQKVTYSDIEDTAIFLWRTPVCIQNHLCTGVNPTVDAAKISGWPARFMDAYCQGLNGRHGPRHSLKYKKHRALPNNTFEIPERHKFC